jgi:hypothetical protein
MGTLPGVKVGRMLAHETQLANEYQFNRKYIDGYIKQELEDSSEMQAIHTKCVEMLDEWSSRDYYPRKNERLLLLRDMDLDILVSNIMVGVAYCVVGDLFRSVVARLASRVRFSDKKEAVETIAEVITVMSMTKIFHIYREEEDGNILIKSLIPLSKRLTDYASQTSYLPPMVCPPNKVTSNFSSGLLKDDRSVLMGKKHHDYPVSLDVINTQNQIPLCIDGDFILNCQEIPNKPLDSIKKVTAWNMFVTDSRNMCALLTEQSDELYFNHGLDTRGRLYCHGYHASYQGNPYRKAMLNFVKEETVEVPSMYQLKESN